MLSGKFSKETRSKIMSSIRGKNTAPELKVRKKLWNLGKRYRIHDRTIFGTPDISNKSKRIIIFIDGCFWHGCDKCYTEPKTNTEFWRNKISRNKERREKVLKELKKDDWKVLQFWEHQIHSDPDHVTGEILSVWNNPRPRDF